MLGVSDQEQQDQLNMAAAHPYVPERDSGPGVFSGMGPTFLGRGFGEGLAQSASTLDSMMEPVREALPASVQQGLFDAFGQDLANKDIAYHSAVKDVVNSLRPDPRTVGFAGQTLEGLEAVSAQATAGSVAAGPYGAAAVIGGSQGHAAYEQARDQGVDENTALGLGVISGVSNAAMPFIPFALGGNLATRMATGAFVNTSLGAAMRKTTSAYLDARGYADMANQYKTLDAQGVLSDIVLGAAFGGLHGLGVEKPAKGATEGAETPVTPSAGISIKDPLPSTVDAAMAVKSAQMYRDAAPGVAVDSAAMNSHDVAMQRASDQLLRDQPVDVSGVLNGEFIPRAPNDDAVAAFHNALRDNGYFDLADEIKSGQQTLSDLGLPAEETPALREPVVQPNQRMQTDIPTAEGEAAGQEPAATDVSQQIVVGKPDMEISSQDGQPVRATDALAQADKDIQDAGTTGKMLEAAAACAGRFL